MSGGPLVAPTSNGAHTSPWFALRYAHNQMPNLAPHELVKLVASIGAETKGKYTLGSVVHAVQNYEHSKEMPSVGTGWRKYVGGVMAAAGRHGKKDWVSGFSYSGGDIPGTGGPSNVQKIADSGAANTVVSAGHGIKSAFGFLTDGKNLIGIIILVVIVIVILGKR